MEPYEFMDSVAKVVEKYFGNYISARMYASVGDLTVRSRKRKGRGYSSVRSDVIDGRLNANVKLHVYDLVPDLDMEFGWLVMGLPEFEDYRDFDLRDLSGGCPAHRWDVGGAFRIAMCPSAADKSSEFILRSDDLRNVSGVDVIANRAKVGAKYLKALKREDLGHALDPFAHHIYRLYLP